VFDEDSKQPVKWQKSEAYDRIVNYCSYQERSLKDIRSKLISHGIYHNELEDLINQLVEENIVNELRYASSFVRSKFKYNHWGKNKILGELRFEQIPNSTILKAMEEIDEKEYLLMTKTLIKKKAKSIQKSSPSPVIIRKKIFSFLVQKGFSYDDINLAFEGIGKL